MARAAVLRHELPDGSHHFDWLFEQASGSDPDERALIAWRLPAPPTGAGGRFEAVRLPPHRRLYLDFEGPVSGGRGTVTRIASGHAEILADTAHRFRVDARFDDIEVSMEGAPSHDGLWVMHLRPHRIG